MGGLVAARYTRLSLLQRKLRREKTSLKRAP